jgi:hypothetical protein
MSQNEELIRRFEQSAAAFEDALRNVPETVLDRMPGPGKWTIRQIAAHLADSELVIASRLRWIAAEPGSPLKAFDQDKWAQNLGYERQIPQEAVEAFRSLRQRTARMLRNLPDSVWKNTGRHEERGTVTLRDLVEGASGHSERHVEQIRSLRKQFASAA